MKPVTKVPTVFSRYEGNNLMFDVVAYFSVTLNYMG